MFDLCQYELRPLRKQDLPIVLEWRNSERVRNMSFNDEIISWERHQRWFQALKGEAPARHLVFYANGKPSGVMNFDRCDEQNGLLYWGFYLGSEGLPRGTGTVLGFLGIQYAVETLRVRKLLGEVMGNNLRSARFHKRLGFEREACLRQQIANAGRTRDLLVFGMLASEWTTVHRRRIGSTLFLRWGNQ